MPPPRVFTRGPNYHQALMLLTTYRRRRHQSDPGDYRPAPPVGVPNEVIEDSDTKGNGPGLKDNSGGQPLNAARNLNGGTLPSKTPIAIVDPLTEFDEYGTELHRDARVWKVYVKEADKTDAELVKGWNDSTDVILIFAALFSAISTAFLIESSKTLQEDPADVSTKTLLIISQTLLTIANGTQLPGSIAPPTDGNPTEFTPSRTAVYVNTLWYLSLSLSLATSFIAILSKDWCHSFMAGRTGHPYDQTCRRQQKWDMIERWKMSELLAVLPSMIHVALLLFSIGLCIQLWDTHTIVALPVICVAGVAVGFYICSSLAAIALDFFPYSTIVSRLCRTEVVKLASQRVFGGLLQLGCFVCYLVVQMILSIIFVWMLVDLCCCTRNIYGRQCSRLDFLVVIEDKLRMGFSRQGWSIGWTKQKSNDVTSLALSWLIKNCEVPQSVDIALQSIAGATEKFLRGPLEECGAAKEISRRLASSNVYRGSNAETILSLYSRALSFLSASTNQGLSAPQMDTGDDLEVKIWDRQTQLEIDVAELITDGKFQPSPQNLAALRIGNTAASRSLKFLKDGTEGADQLFESIIKLLEEHLSNKAPLHPSALFSLLNGLSLLSLFADNPTATSSLPALCVKIDQNTAYSYTDELRLALFTCALIQNKHAKKTRLSQPGGSIYVAGAVRTLVEFQSQGKLRPLVKLMTLRSVLHMSWEDYNPATEPNLSNPRDLWGVQTYELNDLQAPSNELVPYFEFLHGISYLTHIGRLYPRTYVLVLKTICQDSSSRVLGWKLLSRCRFQKLSLDLGNFLSSLSIGGQLTQATKASDQAMQFFAHGQLWLFFTLYFTLPPGDHRIHSLKSCVGLYNLEDVTGDEARYEHLGDLMERSWYNSSSRQIVVGSLGVYAYRLMECLLQSRNQPLPEEIFEALRNTPQELRGLSSFIDQQPQSTGEPEVIAPGKEPQINASQMGGDAALADRDAYAVGEDRRATSNAALIEPHSEPNNDQEKAGEGEMVSDRVHTSGGNADTRESETQPVARRFGEEAEEVPNDEAPRMRAYAVEGSGGLGDSSKVEDNEPGSANDPSRVPDQDEVCGAGHADRSALGKGDVIIDMGK